jgi:HK97 gp10 family phage protein
VNGKFLPTAAAIVEADAKRRAPVKDGFLRGSIASRVDRETATIYTDIEYAQAVEYGTRPHIITVKSARVLSDGKRVFGTSVNHPGTKAQPYMRPAIDKNRKKLIELYRKVFRGVFSGIRGVQGG